MDSKLSFFVNAWAWRQRHSQLNCLITEGSTWDWDNCLLFMLLLCVVIESYTWCCESTTIENRKQQNTDNVLLLVENWDIKLEILNKLAHLNLLETQITVLSELFFFSRFFSWPRNYYNDNNKMRQFSPLD